MDFLVKLGSVFLTLANISLVGYCLVRLGQFLSPPKGKLYPRAGRYHRATFYVLVFLQAAVFLWLFEYLPTSLIQLRELRDNDTLSRGALALNLTVLFIAFFAAAEASGSEYDPPIQYWQKILESQLNQAYENKDEVEINRVVMLSIRMYIEGSYGQDSGDAMTLLQNFSNISGGELDADKEPLVSAFKSGWNEKNNEYGIENALFRLGEVSLPLLLDRTNERNRLLKKYLG